MKANRQKLWVVLALLMLTLCLPLLAQAAPGKPAISSMEWTGKGVQLTWGARQGATSYEVWRSNKKTTGFKKVATTAKTSYLDAKAVQNKTYFYYLIAVGNGRSAPSNTKSIWTVTGPRATRTSRSDGLYTVKWTKVNGATAYGVYRAAKGTDTYTRIAKVSASAARTYVDTSITTAGTWNYAVVAYTKSADGQQVASPYGRQTACPYGPSAVTTISATVNQSNGKISVKWGSANRVSYYKVYLKSNGKTTELGKTTGTNGTYATTVQGEFTVHVRAYGKIGTKTVGSANSPTVKLRILAKPNVTLKLGQAPDGDNPGTIKVSWPTVAGANAYNLKIVRSGGTTYKDFTTNSTEIEVEAHELITISCQAKYKATGQTTIAGSYGTAKTILANWGKTYVLIIGNADYDNLNLVLDGPYQDRAAMNSLFKGLPGNAMVEVLADATCNEMKAHAINLFSNATAKDTCVFYYSGHGLPGKDNPSQKGALVGIRYGEDVRYDRYDYLTVSELRSLLDSAAPDASKVVLLDSCLSGNHLKANGSRSSDISPEAFNRSVINAFAGMQSNGSHNLASGGYYVLTAASANQDCYEVYVKVNESLKGVGAFTCTLLKGSGYDELIGRFLSKAAADTSADGYITLTELYTYVKNNVNKMLSSHTQDTQVYPSGSTFVLWKTK